MKPYFKSPIHLSIFFLEMTIITLGIVSTVLGCIAYSMGLHHGFHTFMDTYEFERALHISFTIWTPIFFLDIIINIIIKLVIFIRKVSKLKAHNSH